LSQTAAAGANIRDVIVPHHSSASSEGLVRRALQAVRSHLGLQIAYVSEFVGDEIVFRELDAPGLEHLAKVGDRRSVDDVYCRHILEGRLPELIPDTAAEPFALAMPITAGLPVGAHVSVPLWLSDGTAYGMFCCLGPAAYPSLNARDLAMMRAFAELAAFEIDRERNLSRALRDKSARIEAILDSGKIDIVYQPIWSLAGNRAIGFECLSRFGAEPVRPPDQWFAEAAEAGKGVELELLAIRQGLAPLASFPDDVYLAVNAAAETVLSPLLAETLASHPLDRIVLEITEHDFIDDFEALSDAVTPLRERGLRLAVDDAGAGHSGLQQILQMRPDLIKLDRSLIQGIGDDPSRRALTAALTLFARETGCRLIAEGVETETELAMLRALGVDKVQGYLLGHPRPLAEALELLGDSPSRAEAA
jgi:EAL domain-containing protein (putative c-di-GMP-specific phosphodiesterase class I)